MGTGLSAALDHRQETLRLVPPADPFQSAIRSDVEKAAAAATEVDDGANHKAPTREASSSSGKASSKYSTEAGSGCDSRAVHA